MPNSIWEFTEDEKKTITSLVAKGRAEEEKNEKFAIIDLDSFYSLFSDDEIVIMKKWLSLDPIRIGYKLPFLRAKDKAENIISIPGQTYVADNKTHKIPCQYLPKEVYEAYQKLNEAIHKDLGKGLLVNFGYRSPARQIFIFFDILEGYYNFDFDKTIQRVCFPDYSEHVCTQRQAIDFMIQKDDPGDDFDKTEEYAWLKQNASPYGFFESYPEGNDLDMMYEPWHWHYEKQGSWQI